MRNQEKNENIFGNIAKEVVGKDFFTKISISINMGGYKEILGVALRPSLS